MLKKCKDVIKLNISISDVISLLKKFFTPILNFFSRCFSLHCKSDVSIIGFFYTNNFVYFRLTIPNPLDVPVLITKGFVSVDGEQIEIGQQKVVVRYFLKIDGYPENKTVYSDYFPIRIEPSNFVEVTLATKVAGNECDFLTKEAKFTFKTNKGTINKTLKIPDKCDFRLV